MSKPYDVLYHIAPYYGGHGSMECLTCRKPIDAKQEDFRSAKRSIKGDWGYVTHHRKCLPNDDGFRSVEKRIAAHDERNQRLRNEAIAFRDKWKIEDLNDLIEELS